MEKRWNVYHGNASLGLKTAKEIREALRHGTLSPFDRVSLEGSHIREDLIEVDEIFREEQLDPEDESVDTEGTQIAVIPSIAAAAPLSSTLRQEPARKAVPSATVQPSRPIPPEPSSTAKGALIASPASSGSRDNISDTSPNGNETSNFRLPESEAIKAPLKRYYVLDKEKVLGPLSALDIQALFNRGVLNKKVRVQKMGSSRAVPIVQFIEGYAGDRLKELAEDGKIPKQIGVGSPSSKVLNELARMADSRRMAKMQQSRVYAIAGGIALLVFLLASVLYERSKNSSNSPTPKARLNETEESSKSAPPPTNKSQRPRLVQKTPTKQADSEGSPGEPELEPSPEPRRVETPTRPTSSPKSLASPKNSTPAPAVKLNPRPSPTPANARPARRVVSKPNPTPPLPPPPPPAPASKGPIAKASESTGRIQTIGPLSFSPAALDACAPKCNLPLRDATGASMKAVFFKSAYYEQLKSRSKSVTLTGSTKIEGGELILIIQDLR